MDSKWMSYETLDHLSHQAMEAIISMWSVESKSFWRNTSQKNRSKGNKDFFPTVSFKCIESLLTVLIENPGLFDSATKKIIEKELIEKITGLDIGNLHSSLDTVDEQKKGKELNEFTLSVYIQTLSRICKLEQNKQKYNELQEKLTNAVDLLHNHSFLKGYLLGESKKDHPFILFHILRAFSLSKEHLSESELTKISEVADALKRAIKTITEELLAKFQLGSINPSDSVALAFCSAALSLDGVFDNRKYITSALKISSSSQDAVGCWPMGRIVHRDKDIESPHLEISTHEIAWAISITTFELLNSYGMGFEDNMMNEIYVHLERSVTYTEKSTVQILDDGKLVSGWCSDHPYDFDIIESWTCSNVLQFVCWVRKLQELSEQQNILKTFTVVIPNTREWPKWLRWNNYKSNSETNSEYPVLSYIEECLIKPIKNHPQELPSPNNRSVSGLLFGPPGTSKTTIVKAIAGALNWPLVMLSPGNFIEGGLESIERMSQLVFEKLRNLSRVVVLFDECDELFRERAPQKSSEQIRGITAFITACMLPKLQDLHDNGKVLFFICTNNFDTIDSAIKRGGRIDHILGIGPPDKDARNRIFTDLETEFISRGNRLPDYWDEIKNKMLDSTDRYIRAELLRLFQVVIDTAPWKSIKEGISKVNQTIEHFDKSLTITSDEYAKFEKQNKDYNHSIIENKG